MTSDQRLLLLVNYTTVIFLYVRFIHSPSPSMDCRNSEEQPRVQEIWTICGKVSFFSPLFFAGRLLLERCIEIKVSLKVLVTSPFVVFARWSLSLSTIGWHSLLKCFDCTTINFASQRICHRLVAFCGRVVSRHSPVERIKSNLNGLSIFVLSQNGVAICKAVRWVAVRWLFMKTSTSQPASHR